MECPHNYIAFHKIETARQIMRLKRCLQAFAYKMI